MPRPVSDEGSPLDRLEAVDFQEKVELLIDPVDLITILGIVQKQIIPDFPNYLRSVARGD